jgi:hypothetical protein
MKPMDRVEKSSDVKVTGISHTGEASYAEWEFVIP